MNLEQYPQAIAEIQYQILNLSQEIEKISQSLEKISTRIKLQVAFDPELKNEQQRKAKEAQLLGACEDYGEKSNLLMKHCFQKSLLEVQLEQFRGEFSVRKLNARKAIAQLELQTQVG